MSESLSEEVSGAEVERRGNEDNEDLQTLMICPSDLSHDLPLFADENGP